MKLFLAPGASSQVSHLALEETGAPFEVELVRLNQGQQHSPDYLAINPKARVPALQTDQGVLTENVAIVAYLAQLFPASGLAPSDPWRFAQMQSFNAYMSSTMHVYFAVGRRAARYADGPAAAEALNAKAPLNVAGQFALIEQTYLQGPWVLGDAFSSADLYLFVMEGWQIERYGPLDPWPRLNAHHQAVAARPAVKRALEREQALRAS